MNNWKVQVACRFLVSKSVSWNLCFTEELASFLVLVFGMKESHCHINNWYEILTFCKHAKSKNNLSI